MTLQEINQLELGGVKICQFCDEYPCRCHEDDYFAEALVGLEVDAEDQE